MALLQRDADAVDRLHVAHRVAQHAALDGKVNFQIVEPHDLRRRRIGDHRLALGLGRQEMLRVGVLGPAEDLGDRSLLDDLALGHDADAVRHFLHDAQVVGDEEQRHAVFGLQALEQLQDLRLDGDVERRGRLVGDQQVRLVGQRHGDHHPLALAARQLMRIGVEALGGLGNADLVEQLEGAPARRFARQPLVQDQHLVDLPLDRVQRVERGHGLLEDHGDAVAAHLQELAGRGADQLAALEADRAGRMPGHRIGQQLQHRERRHRLARARFADQRHGLAAGDLEAHALHRLDRVDAGAEGNREVADLKQGLVHGVMPFAD
jgi:hypothetical protein